MARQLHLQFFVLFVLGVFYGTQHLKAGKHHPCYYHKEKVEVVAWIFLLGHILLHHVRRWSHFLLLSHHRLKLLEHLELMLLINIHFAVIHNKQSIIYDL
jgi:hypothetical protein